MAVGAASARGGRSPRSNRHPQVGAGLENLGNTCYLNATLQCLTYLPPVANFALSGKHSKLKARLLSQPRGFAASHAVLSLKQKAGGFSALHAVCEHVVAALRSSGKTLSPLEVVRNIRVIGRSFRKGRQEDAHEFTRYLVEAMQASSSAGRKPVPGAADGSFVSRCFGGRLRSQLLCSCCKGRESNTYDPFLDLSLEINSAPSVLKALRRFCATEVLDGENKCVARRRNVASAGLTRRAKGTAASAARRKCAPPSASPWTWRRRC